MLLYKKNFNLHSFLRNVVLLYQLVVLQIPYLLRYLWTVCPCFNMFSLQVHMYTVQAQVYTSILQTSTES